MSQDRSTHILECSKENLLPSKRKFGEENSTPSSRTSPGSALLEKTQDRRATSNRRAIGPSDRVLRSKSKNTISQVGKIIPQVNQPASKKLHGKNNFDKVRPQESSDADCFLSFIGTLNEASRNKDKDKSDLVNRMEHVVSNGQSGDDVVALAPLIPRSSPQNNIENQENDDDAIARDNLVVSHSITTSKINLEKVLAATNAELRQKLCQYEQFMLQQKNQVQDLQRKLENQAMEHASKIESMHLLEQSQKDENCKLKTKITELQNANESTRATSEAKLSAVQKELDDIRSENEKTKGELGFRIECLVHKEKLLKEENCNLKTEISSLESAKAASEAHVSAVKEELANTRHSSKRGREKLTLEINRLAENERTLKFQNCELNTKVLELQQNAKDSAKRFHQKFQRSKADHARSMDTMQTMFQKALDQQRTFSAENRQLRRNQQEQQGRISSLEAQNQHLRQEHQSDQDRISNLQSRLEQMEEEMTQMEMNHAMELGFQNGVE